MCHTQSSVSSIQTVRGICHCFYQITRQQAWLQLVFLDILISFTIVEGSAQVTLVLFGMQGALGPRSLLLALCNAAPCQRKGAHSQAIWWWPLTRWAPSFQQPVIVNLMHL